MEKKIKLKKRKCKNCKEFYMPENERQQKQITPLCSIKCIVEYNRKLIEKRQEKESKEKFEEMKISAHSSKNKGALQDEINKLSKMIDKKYGLKTCIDCGKPFGNNQIDAAHFHSRGAHSSLRYNLHNLHSALGYCNQYSDKHKTGYINGLINRYGIMYFNQVENLIKKHPYIKLGDKEVVEKLKLVRKMIREFGELEFTDPTQERDRYNTLIGIYV